MGRDGLFRRVGNNGNPPATSMGRPIINHDYQSAAKCHLAPQQKSEPTHCRAARRQISSLGGLMCSRCGAVPRASTERFSISATARMGAVLTVNASSARGWIAGVVRNSAEPVDHARVALVEED